MKGAYSETHLPYATKDSLQEINFMMVSIIIEQ
jgi:hypothetical protein